MTAPTPSSGLKPSESIVTDDRTSDGPARLQTAIGAAMVVVSLAGLAYAALGLAWEIQQQVFYALVGGLTCWKLVR